MCYFGFFLLGVFLSNPGHICGWGATCENPLLSSHNFTQGRLMKMKLLVTNATAIGPPGKAERAVLGVILAGRVFCQLGTHLWSLMHFVR